MRTIWNGSINFGLVNIPIGLAVAQQRKDVSFRTLHRECGTPIKQKRWCPFHERDVEADELVKGWEFAKGQFVVVEESDLEAVALTRSQSIDIMRFVPLADVDPIYFDRAYYLSPADARPAPALRAPPSRDAGGEHRRDREVRPLGQGEPLPIRPLGDGLALETLYYAEDIRSRKEIDEAVAETEVRSPSSRWPASSSRARRRVRPEGVRERVPNELRAMLEAKLAGEEIAVPEPTAPAQVVDLMEALKRASLRRRRTRPARPRRRLREEARGVRLALVLLGRRRRRRAGGLELRLEEGLVDLAVVDRDGLLEADANDLVAVDAQLFRELLGG